MMLRSIWMIFLGVLLITLSAACGKKEVEKEKKETDGIVVISTTPGDAVVRIQGKKYASGQEIKLPAGDYVALVEKVGWGPAWKKITVKPGEKQNVSVSMRENKTTVLLVTEEAGVRISFKKGDKVIKSGSSPLYVTNVLPGDYVYTAEKQGYTSIMVPLKINSLGMTYKEHIKMDNTIGFLDLDLNPKDAVVYVNDEEVSYIPGKALRLSAGNYKVRVVKDGYEEKSSTVDIEKEKRSKLTFELRQKKSRLSVIVEGTPGATVTINGSVENSPEEWREVDAGTYKIEVTKDFHDKAEKEITLKPGQEEQVKFTALSRNTGSVSLKMEHPAIRIFLDGKLIGVTQPDPSGGAKDFLVEGLAIGGKYKFSFEHPYQFKTVARTVAIKQENKNVQLKVPFTVANATVKYKQGDNRKGGRVFVKEISDTELEITFPTSSGKGAYSEDVKKDEVIVDYLPSVSVDPKYKSSSYDLLKAAGK